MDLGGESAGRPHACNTPYGPLCWCEVERAERGRPKPQVPEIKLARPSRDPALDAAARAMKARLPLRASGALAVAAARAMAKPIRKLHQPIRTAPDYAYCDECDSQWPCKTAKLVYSTEELQS